MYYIFLVVLLNGTWFMSEVFYYLYYNGYKDFNMLYY